jgi:hypothetical protein
MDSLKNLTSKDLILELGRRGLFTSSEYNSTFMSDPQESFKIVLTKGVENKTFLCRECHQEKDSSKFNFYQARVDREGYLMRSNALCSDCSLSLNEERQRAFDNSIITEKPSSGSLCPKCSRPWSNNWHKHHEGDKFIDWWCGECNMRHADQRNKI